MPTNWKRKKPVALANKRRCKNLVEVSAERERLLLNAIQALDQLAQDKKTSKPISTVRPQTMPSTEGEGDTQKPEQRIRYHQHRD